LVFGVFALVWLIILWRTFQLQVVQRDRLAEIADRENHKVVKLNPVRGEIYDRNGEKLAVSLETDSVFAEPTKLENPETAARELAAILGIDRRQLADKLKQNDTFTWVERQIDPEKREKIEALNLKGIAFVKESKRFYPNNLLGAHVLGFVGVDSRGLEGLEMGYDQYLLGGANEWRVKRDALGRTYLDPDTAAPRPGQGKSLTLTLDRRIQYITEKALTKAVEEFGAKGGVALVVKPDTGEILASAVYPGFNPNVFGRYDPAQRRNRVLTDTFDPGSTFKVFIVAGALEDGVVQPDDMIDCEKGAFSIGRRVIHDHHPYGWLKVSDVIKVSSNIGTAKIGGQLGPAQMHHYLTRFNFGERTGVDYPGESPGLLRPYKKWRPIDAANVAFGQGVAVTALQLTMAMCALANDGVLMRPYIISKITDSNGFMVKKTQPEVVRQVISPATATEMQTMLRQVVMTGGTGTRADSPGYPAAGKTGTAQKVDPVTKTYSDRKYVSSFVGYVPFDNPQLTILVSLDEPWPKTYGGTVAAPAFREIAEQVLPMLNVPPVPGVDKPLPKDVRSAQADLEAAEGVVVRPLPKDRPSAQADLEAAEALVESRSNKVSVKLNPQASQAVAELARELRQSALQTEPGPDGQTQAGPTGALAVEPEPAVMPDLSGLSMRHVIDMMSEYDVQFTFTGSGLAVWQQPSPGNKLAAGQVCQVRFEQW
jgi:cell division protein FtsI (penicillin-binding protein 3)